MEQFLGTGRRKADLVINALYHENFGSTNIFCGEKYYLAPKMFLMYKPIEIRNKVEKVFICFTYLFGIGSCFFFLRSLSCSFHD